MKSLFASIGFLLLTMSAASAEETSVAVARVDYGEIEDLLTTVALNVEGNEELRDRYHAKKQAAKVAQEKLHASIMRGEGVNPGEAALSFLNDDEDQKKVEQLCQKHLLELIEKTFAGKYDLIFKDGYRSSLIYTKAPVDDITAVVKQELLKAIPRN